MLTILFLAHEKFTKENKYVTENTKSIKIKWTVS